MQNCSKYYSIEKLMSYNNPSFVERMIQLFIKSSQEYLSDMDKAVMDCNLTRMNQLAHFIKPSIDLLSINSVTQSVRDIEQATELTDDLISKVEFTKQQLQIASQQMMIDYM